METKELLKIQKFFGMIIAIIGVIVLFLGEGIGLLFVIIGIAMNVTKELVITVPDNQDYEGR